MARTDQECRQEARRIAQQARAGEWRDLNDSFDGYVYAREYAAAEAMLVRMADVLDREVNRLLANMPECDRERVGVAVTEYFGRLCGLVS